MAIIASNVWQEVNKKKGGGIKAKSGIGEVTLGI